MGYVFNFKDVIEYEQWMKTPHNRFATALECQLMRDMLDPLSGRAVLDIGCGIGTNFLPLLERGLQVTGLDPSPYMLDIATKNVGNRVDLHRGFAEDLPFDDNSFHYACLVTTLEFVEDPIKAIEEASRVTRDRIYVGILNRYAINGIQLRVKGVFTKTIYNHARFFSIWELKKIIRALLGDVPISWRTACQLPAVSGELAQKFEQIRLVQRFPFGALAGMVISLVPKFRSRPLPITYRPKRTTGTATG